MTISTLRSLSREECFIRVRRERLGRVSVKIGELPSVLPVNDALLEEDIIIRTRRARSSAPR